MCVHHGRCVVQVTPRSTRPPATHIPTCTDRCPLVPVVQRVTPSIPFVPFKRFELRSPEQVSPGNGSEPALVPVVDEFNIIVITLIIKGWRYIDNERYFMDGRTLLDGLVDGGLSEYQADAYLTLLERGTSPAVDVAKNCSIPVPRIYDILNELEQMGYVETLDRDKLHARACDPLSSSSRTSTTRAHASPTSPRRSRTAGSSLPSVNTRST